MYTHKIPQRRLLIIRLFLPLPFDSFQRISSIEPNFQSPIFICYPSLAFLPFSSVSLLLFHHLPHLRTMFRRSSTEHERLNSADPMSSGNPYASQSPQGFNQKPKKSRKKLWIILGVILALIIIIGAVVGGVVGSRSGGSDPSSGSGNSADQANGGGNSGGNGNTGAPSGVSNVNSEALTATEANRYLAVATNSDYMLPVYPTGVSLDTLPLPPPWGPETFADSYRPTLPDTLLQPHPGQVTRGRLTHPHQPTTLSGLTPDSVLLSTSGTPSPVV